MIDSPPSSILRLLPQFAINWITPLKIISLIRFIVFAVKITTLAMPSQFQAQYTSPPAPKGRKRSPPGNVTNTDTPTPISQSAVNAAIFPVIMSLLQNMRIAQRGDLFIQPANQTQIAFLLNLQIVGSSTVKSVCTASETKVKRVIFGVPLDELDDIIEELTKNQGVILFLEFWTP